MGESLVQPTISWGKMGMAVPSWVGWSGLLAAFMIFCKEPEKSPAALDIQCMSARLQAQENVFPYSIQV